MNHLATSDHSSFVRNSGWSRRPRPVELLIMLLLVTGFFIGPIKLLGASWVGYLSVDGLAMLIIIVVVAERIAHRTPVLATSPLSIPLLLLAGFCVLELGNPSAPFIRSVLGLRSWVLYLAFYFVGYYTFRAQEQLHRLYVLLVALGVLTAAYGVYQWQVGPQSFANWSEYYGRYANLAWSAKSGGVVFRAFSTFVSAGTFGGNMALLMLIAFSVAASTKVRNWLRIASGAAFAVMGAGVAVSGSRGPVALLALAAAVAMAFVPGIWPKLSIIAKGLLMALAASLVVALFVGPVVGERFATMIDPENFFWKWFGPLTSGIRVALDHPLGMGLGYTAGVPSFISNPALQGLPTMNVDSGYGSAAAELGLLGLAFFTYFAFKVGIEGIRTWTCVRAGQLRDLLLGPALFAATYPLVSVIGQPQATLPSSIYYWLLIGMLMKAPTLQRALDADHLLRSQVHPRQ